MLYTTVIIESSDTEDFPTIKGAYIDDDGPYLDLVATCSGCAVRSDYGVPGSPVWYEIEDVDVEDVCLNGKTYTQSELKAAHGELANEIIDLLCEMAGERDDWEG